MYRDALYCYGNVMGSGLPEVIAEDFRREKVRYCYAMDPIDTKFYQEHTIDTTKIFGHTLNPTAIDLVEGIGLLDDTYTEVYQHMWVGKKLSLIDIHDMLCVGFEEDHPGLRKEPLTLDIPGYGPATPEMVEMMYDALTPVTADTKSILAFYSACMYYKFFNTCNENAARLYTNYLLAINGVGYLKMADKHRPHYIMKLNDLYKNGNSDGMVHFLADRCLVIYIEERAMYDPNWG